MNFSGFEPLYYSPNLAHNLQKLLQGTHWQPNQVAWNSTQAVALHDNVQSTDSAVHTHTNTYVHQQHYTVQATTLCTTITTQYRKHSDQNTCGLKYYHSTLCKKVVFPYKITLLALWLRRLPREWKIWGSNPACNRIFPGRVIPVT